MSDSNESLGNNESPTKIDYFRDTPIRYLGYANEVGEAFRQLVSRRVVQLSYVISSTYCFADATSKALEVKESSEYIEVKKTPNRQAVEMFVEAAVWQGLASVIIPGFTINRICWLSSIALRKTASSFVNPGKQKLLVTLIGLGSIPLIIKPIDSLVDRIMEKSISVAGKVEDMLDK